MIDLRRRWGRIRDARTWLVLSGRVTVGSSPQVDRVFVICGDCGRVVPAWRCVMAKVQPGDRIGCGCGSGVVLPRVIPNWRAAWWVLVRGFLIRRVLGRRRKQEDWDPRLPVRVTDRGVSFA